MTQLRKDLVEAVKDGKYDTVQGMLSSGLYTDFHDEAMLVAAGWDQVEIIELSADFGARDITGIALEAAINGGHVESIKGLLKLYEKDSLDHVNRQGHYLLRLSILKCTDINPGKYMSSYFGPKLVRWLMGAGANPKMGAGKANQSALDLMDNCRAMPSLFEKGMSTLDGIHRLLLQEEAVHAESWLWFLLGIGLCVCFGLGVVADGVGWC